MAVHLGRVEVVADTCGNKLAVLSEFPYLFCDLNISLFQGLIALMLTEQKITDASDFATILAFPF